MPLYTFKDLVVWQKSIALTKAIYALTRSFPREELYGLTSQMRRCAVSIPSNIAEGRHRGTRKDFVQFLRIALGSTAELETQVIIAKELHDSVSFDYTTIESLLLEISKMLKAMINKLNP
jgi:four helix bundle protein